MNKVINIVKSYPGVFIALLIAFYAAYSFISRPPALLSKLSYYEIAKKQIDREEYRNALDNLRKAKYKNPSSFTINYHIALCLSRMEVTENSEKLLRYYMLESFKLAGNSEEMTNVRDLWKAAYNMPEKFPIIRAIGQKNINQLDSMIEDAEKKEINECKNYEECYQNSGKQHRKEQYVNAQLLLIKGISKIELSRAENPAFNLQFLEAMFRVADLYLIRNDCGKMRWKYEEENRRIYTLLKRYDELQTRNCGVTARKIYFELARDFNSLPEAQKTSLENTPQIQRLISRAALAAVLAVKNPASTDILDILSNRITGDNPTKYLKESVELLQSAETLPQGEVFDRAIYKRVAEHVAEWEPYEGLDFTNFAKELNSINSGQNSP